VGYGISLARSARLGMVSTYPPRRCGLAGYAAELVSALAPEFDIVVCAVDRHGLTYPDEVAVVVREEDPDDYPRAARILAEHGVDAVLIQHDASIYGGRAGAHLTRLTQELRSRGIPYLLALHSLQPATDQAWSRTVAHLANAAASVVVFTRAAKSLAVARGLADADRIRVLPAAVRGVRARVIQLRPALAQALAGDATVLATVGFLGPSKGLETGLAAFARVAHDRPALRYVIAGATHPEVARGDGETYRVRLRELADQLDLADRVHFVDAHLTATERAALLARTDLYVAPSFAVDRTCSGSLTAAVVAGCAVVAGWHPFAAELLAGAGGVVVPGGHVDALAGAMAELLDDRVRFAAARRAAGRLGRHLTWPALAGRYAAAVRETVLA
jgi:glycosyltransferase involved in cell wall biosynthesis